MGMVFAARLRNENVFFFEYLIILDLFAYAMYLLFFCYY
jgi:hypothetical protein